MLVGAILTSFIAVFIITPFIKRFAIKIGATDKPNQRKVHEKVMPRLGGLAIYISFIIGFLVLQPESPYTMSILLGGFIIIITGVVDDLYEISARWKLLGQLIAASILIFGGINVTYINLPFDGRLELGLLGIPLTIFWIVGITNAINLIDGLDGLAAGVSSIVLGTIAVMAFIMGNPFVIAITLILLASTLGFLFFNFYPAKIFMGDTGALFLGFMIAVMSLLGFKNVTLYSLIVPILILGVPISDTIFAIIRRILNKTPISAPDKSHLHHCLLRAGLSHRKTVLFIYFISSFFSAAAIFLSQTTLWGSLLILTVVLFSIEILVEKIGLVGTEYRPILNLVKAARFAVVEKDKL